MTANNYIETIKSLPLQIANDKLAEICGIKNFFNTDKTFQNAHLQRISLVDKEEYGDWQTNRKLAIEICKLLKANGINPKIIIEPTCGKGNFILAALQTFDNIETVYGIEIYKPYLQELKMQILQYHINHPNSHKPQIQLFCENIFDYDFSSIKRKLQEKEILVLGNPPWVTNSKLGGMGSKNIPKKNNSKKLNGLDAITGKSNFDIAEYIIEQLIHFLIGEKAHIALLVKNSVIKNIIFGQQYNKFTISKLRQYGIDTKKEFGVSVAASLFYLQMGNTIEKQCEVIDFYNHTQLVKYGWHDQHFVADIEAYARYKHFDGKSPLTWWSGLKHDCAKIMELTFANGIYTNGLGEIVDIENEMIYPLIKSSDIKGDIITSTRKYLIITQKTTSDDTEQIKYRYPKTYQYLLQHSTYFDKRGSRIYQGRPRFCIFGIGKYSFKPYKIVVSGLYKQPNFALVKPINGKVAMLDDTCYMLGFDNFDDALITQHILKSKHVQTLIKALLFLDAKRVINKELLMRIDLTKALELIPEQTFKNFDLQRYKHLLSNNTSPQQYTLF